MAKFTCSISLLLAKRKPKKSSKTAKKIQDRGSVGSKCRINPINIVSPSSETVLNLNHPFTLSNSFLPREKDAVIPKVLSNDSFVGAGYPEVAAYEGGDEHDEIRLKQANSSCLNLQAKAELTLASQGSKTDSNSCGSDIIKMEIHEGISPETLGASGHVSDLGMEGTDFWGSPSLRRSCSNIEMNRDNKLINSYSSSSSCSLSGSSRGEYEDHCSPLDRVNSWVNSLENCTFFSLDEEENCIEKEDEETTSAHHHLEIAELSEKNHALNSQLRSVEEVMQQNYIIQSLNSSSPAAHFCGMGLKVIPSISIFLSLKSLNLSGNFIVHITPGTLPKNLHTLDLSRNKISSIEGLRDLTKLKILKLSYNRISRIGQGLSNCTNIKELYLAGNKISNVEGLHRLLKLTVLDLSFNKITTAKSLSQLVANYNSLVSLSLIGNPIQSNIGDEQIRKTVMSLLSPFTYLNKQPIRHQRMMREVVKNNAAKAALRDAGWSSRRRPTRRTTFSPQNFSSKSVMVGGSSNHLLKNMSQYSLSRRG